MKYSDMTEHERFVLQKCIDILSDDLDERGNTPALVDFVDYSHRLYDLDEGELYLLDNLIVKSSSMNADKYLTLRRFLDHPEERFKYQRFIR